MTEQLSTRMFMNRCTLLLCLQRFCLWQWKKLPNLPCTDVVPKYWRPLWTHYAWDGSLHQLSMICLLCKVSNLHRIFLFMPAIHFFFSFYQGGKTSIYGNIRNKINLRKKQDLKCRRNLLYRSMRKLKSNEFLYIRDHHGIIWEA